MPSSSSFAEPSPLLWLLTVVTSSARKRTAANHKQRENITIILIKQQMHDRNDDTNSDEIHKQRKGYTRMVKALATK